jgi:two-component system sensor histidine kinase KdpD
MLIEYWYTLWIIAVVALPNWAAAQWLGYHSAGFFFLCTLLALGLFYSLGPVLFGAALSALIWDYFFIPPTHSFSVASPEDALMIGAFFLSAAVTGLLARRIRESRRAALESERATQLLYRLASAFSTGSQEKNLLDAEQVLAQAFGMDFVILVATPQGSLAGPFRESQSFRLWEEDLAQAEAAYRSRRPGKDARLAYLPLNGSGEAYGVLACRLGGRKELEDGEFSVLDTAARRLGLALERARLEQGAREAKLLRESEQLHQALLNSISHELRTPLTALLGSAAALRHESGNRDALLDEISGAGERLNRVIENLLDMARLNTGMLALKREWQDPAELVRLTLGRLKAPLARHRLELELQEGLPLLNVDYRLIEHALSNLLLNAAAYSPEGSRIRVSARRNAESLEIRVTDEGPGVPKESAAQVFEKFYRLPGSAAGGTGLGLYITRSLMQAHGGDASLEAGQGKGASFLLILPLQPQPSLPQEAA